MRITATALPRLGLLGIVVACGIRCSGAAAQDTPPPVIVRRQPAPLQAIPRPVPPPVSVIPGYPVPFEQGSILDDRTRFLTSGPAQARCPGQPVVFVAGVVNPYRPTAPGDGAFMCRSDAVAEGYLAR